MNVRIFAFAGMLCIGALVTNAAVGQQTSKDANPLADSRMGLIPSFQSGGGGAMQSYKLAKDYIKSEKEDEKKEIKKKLQDSLAHEFDQTMDKQQKELKVLETQIENLKAQLKKRAESKTSIIERRLDQMILDAQGLGWNSGPQSGGFGAGGFGAPVSPGGYVGGTVMKQE